MLRKNQRVENQSSARKFEVPALKGPWGPAETALLMKLVTEHGPHRWSRIARYISGWSGKQARERWNNHLDPTLKSTKWSPKEDEVVTWNVLNIGKKWSTIAKLLPGRSDNDVKNWFNGTVRARLCRSASTQTNVQSSFNKVM